MAQAESQVEGSQPGGKRHDDIIETKLNNNNDYDDDNDNYTQQGSHIGESDAYDEEEDDDNSININNNNNNNYNNNYNYNYKYNNSHKNKNKNKQKNNNNNNNNVVELKLDDSDIITYGSRIVLEHVNTEFRLHSHHIDYPVGSKQQQVTCFNQHNTDDYWIIKPGFGIKNSIKLWQMPVINGDIIQLQHYNTGCYLRSHYLKSYVSQQYEVSCFWGHDTNNNWKIELKNDSINKLLIQDTDDNDDKTRNNNNDTFSNSEWKKGIVLNLIHCNTKGTLHSHNKKYPNWGKKQNEVTTYFDRDRNDDWFVSKVEKNEWF